MSKNGALLVEGTNHLELNVKNKMKTFFTTLIVILISYSCNGIENSKEEIKKSNIENLLRIYIPTTLYDSINKEVLDSDVLNDTIIEYTYSNKYNNQFFIQITINEDWNSTGIDSYCKLNIENIKNNNPKTGRIYYSKILENKLGIVHAKVYYSNLERLQWVVFCKASKRNKDISIQISCPKRDSLYSKLIDSLPLIVSSITTDF
jgi:hypothetical protein